MPYSLEDKLVVGITSRALFGLDRADTVFRDQGLSAYRAYQREHEDDILEPGTGFYLVKGLLRINERAPERLVEVIIISRNDADSGMRIFNSIEAHGLDISRAAFTDGRDPWAYLGSFQSDLFLSAQRQDVERALGLNFPAALVCSAPERLSEDEVEEVRIGFDGDAVLFDAESERVYQEQGLDAFLEREAALANRPMNPGPFKPFLMGLKRIQDQFPEENSPIRTALITARNAPAHRRVVKTLRAWGVRVDETFFLGGIEKVGILDVLRPHIYFDDQMIHLERAQARTPAAHVIPVGAQLQLPLDRNEALSSEESPAQRSLQWRFRNRRRGETRRRARPSPGGETLN
jgi:5'-nucleotidase